MHYTITLSAAELDLVHDDLVKALGRFVDPKPATVRKPAASVKVFAPNTGDARLDAFMRSHHDPKWKAPRIPRPNLKPPRLSPNAYARVEAEWNAAASLAWAVQGVEVAA